MSEFVLCLFSAIAGAFSISIVILAYVIRTVVMEKTDAEPDRKNFWASILVISIAVAHAGLVVIAKMVTKYSDGTVAQFIFLLGGAAIALFHGIRYYKLWKAGRASIDE